jgi:hypothetical protein
MSTPTLGFGWNDVGELARSARRDIVCGGSMP